MGDGFLPGDTLIGRYTVAATVMDGVLSERSDRKAAQGNAQGRYPRYPLRLFLDCSTAHLSWAARAYLDAQAKDDKELIVTMPYGWFMWADEDPRPDLPTDIAAIVAHARSFGAEYILFDRDAPTNEALPIFEKMR